METTPTGLKWGERIRAARREQGMSQYALADALDVRQGAISAWECGTRLPSHRNLAAICRVLGLPTDAFTYDEAA